MINSAVAVLANPIEGGTPPRLVEFDGIHKLASQASRQRLLSHRLDFTLIVNEEGKPTECKLARKFRRKATETAICKPLLKYMVFEPARDAAGNPVVGTYSNTVDFNMWMTERGYLEPEYRN